MLKFLIEKCYRNNLSHYTSLKLYFDQDLQKRWLYISYLISSLYSSLLVYGFFKSLYSCSFDSTSNNQTGLFDGTLFTERSCLHNMTDIQANWSVIYISVMIFDLSVQWIMVRDFTSSGAIQSYFHHAITIFGSFSGLYLGSFIGTISNGSLITEISTPFVNNRWFLAFHKKADGSLNIYNGLIMTLLFCFARVFYLSFITVFCLWPALNQFKIDLAQNGETLSFAQKLTYFSLYAYLVFVALNYYWFYRMVLGCLKVLGKR